MKIYFACAIVGGRRDEDVYQEIVDQLLRDGHQVLTERLVNRDTIQLEITKKPREVYDRDTNWILESDILIAEVSTPSHGVGYEIGFALAHSIPVICLYKVGMPVSKLILGNRDPYLSIIAYEEVNVALDLIRQRLGAF
jgi:nucleoside 2-deoxyribosyltransferase